ncbi:hypothetical protein BJV74DRAFT_944710 [Russula compacta]|nr:hypothetical protein BJV74DRAFT_944710 [Russula compacta]
MRVAVVGSGVTGLAATWLLNEYSAHEVHLYEADDRPGGHANTVHVARPGKEPVDVDTGFIVFNPPTYPNFLRFLELHSREVEVIKTQMTFSVSRDAGAFEWAGDGLRSVFCQPRRVLDLGMWRMLFDIVRFNACAVRVLSDDADADDLSIGEYLQREGYSPQFRDDYLIPMTAAVWSTPPDVCAVDFPAKTLIRFMYNHHLLQITGKPSWLTIKGGSKKYVKSILAQLPAAQLHLSTPVHAVCGATPEEREILGAFHWSRNEVWLHSDENLMPRSRLAWSCWNYITRTTVDEQGISKPNDPQVSFPDWMNDLQRIPASKHGHLFATLNPLSPPSPARVHGRYTYAHPVLSASATRAQRRLAQLNANARSSRPFAFAGAWTRYGFHEDGFTAGLRAAVTALPGVAPPFAIADADVLRGEPRVVRALVSAFDVLEAARALVALLFGRLMLFVRAVMIGPAAAEKKVD